MESEARYTLVGATLVALVVAAIVAVFWLKGAGPREEIDRYTIYFERQPLDGLQIGADVTMLGVSVGRVEGYTIDARGAHADAQGSSRVRVTVRVSSRTPVASTTTAVVQRNVLTGVARISLVTPRELQPALPLSIAPAGEEHPVIPEGQSDLEKIADAANRIAASGADALDSINATLSLENRKALGQMLANLSDVTGTLNARLDRLGELTAALNQTAVDVGEAARRIGGAARPAAEQAEATLRDMSRTVEHLERDLTAVAQRAETAIDVGALEISATAQELRSAAEIVARTLDRLGDLRTSLLGPSPRQLGPGERVQ
jgi:phospholipid/cholesterol/gamma-HCH transport system substrate-binding protein